MTTSNNWVFIWCEGNSSTFMHTHSVTYHWNGPLVPLWIYLQSLDPGNCCFQGHSIIWGDTSGNVEETGGRGRERSKEYASLKAINFCPYWFESLKLVTDLNWVTFLVNTIRQQKFTRFSTLLFKSCAKWRLLSVKTQLVS